MNRHPDSIAALLVLGLLLFFVDAIFYVVMVPLLCLYLLLLKLFGLIWRLIKWVFWKLVFVATVLMASAAGAVEMLDRGNPEDRKDGDG